MFKSSSLSEEQREAVVALFEASWGARAVATQLRVSVRAIGRLHDRWRVRGGTVLVSKPTKGVFSFEFKIAAVQRCLAGENKIALSKELGLSSSTLISKWVRLYRDEGEGGLRPKQKGRPRKTPEAVRGPESELTRLRRENERLRAEVAFLGKVEALRDEERR